MMMILGLSYYLTYEDQIPHGAAVGRFLPGYLEEAGKECQQEVLGLLGFESCEDFRKYIMTGLGDMSISEERKTMSIEGMMENHGKLANCPYEVNRAVLECIMK